MTVSASPEMPHSVTIQGDDVLTLPGVLAHLPNGSDDVFERDWCTPRMRSSGDSTR